MSYKFDSANSLELSLVPVPTVTHVEPQNIFNLLKAKSVTVRGANFIKSTTTIDEELLCLFTS